MVCMFTHVKSQDQNRFLLHLFGAREFILPLLTALFFFGIPFFASADTVTVIDQVNRAADCSSLGPGWWQAAPPNFPSQWSFCAHNAPYDYMPGATSMKYIDQVTWGIFPYNGRDGCQDKGTGWESIAAQGRGDSAHYYAVCAHFASINYAEGPTSRSVLINYDAMGSGSSTNGNQCTVSPVDVPPWVLYNGPVTDFAHWYATGWCELRATHNLGIPPPSCNDIGLRVYDKKAGKAITINTQTSISSPLRIRRKGVTYGIPLVDPGNGSASRIRIKTSTGIRALQMCL